MLLYIWREKTEKERCEMRRKNKEMNNDSFILTADEVAGYLKLSKITIYKLAKDGALPGFRVGGSWRFSKANIEKLMS